MDSQEKGRYVIGLDLGQAQEHSALAMIEWFPMPWPQPGTFPTPPHYSVRTLKRWPIGTPYRVIAEAMIKFMQSPPLDTSYSISVIDDTGVGEPVGALIVNTLNRARVRGAWCIATITDGHTASLAGNAHWHVPKKTLVSVLQVLLQSRRLHVAAGLPDAKALTQELQSFRTKITTVRNDTLELWRERDYDDLVFAVALASWWAERSRDWFIYREPEEPPLRVLIA
jgi:hypothetical protein